MRFIDGVCKIAMPKKYYAKKAVDSSGNVKHYMKSSQINMIVQTLIMAGYGQVQASELGTMGTFAALADLREMPSLGGISSTHDNIHIRVWVSARGFPREEG